MVPSVNVLVVDDNAELLQLVGASLARDGHRIVSVDTAAAATTRLGSETFDVIVLDIGLPDGSGFDVCREARESGMVTPILFLTAHAAVDQRMSVLVERLLMSATGSAAARVTEAVAMEDVVADVVAARPEAERARVTIAIEATGMVRGDEALLRIVVDNLVDNALKFAKSGSVGVRLVETPDEVRLTVHDEGPGIDPADADRLLLAFARGTNAAVAGHGLGLSIVAHAVRLHGGDVHFVKPQTGRGAELRVTLPAWTADPRA